MHRQVPRSTALNIQVSVLKKVPLAARGPAGRRRDQRADAYGIAGVRGRSTSLHRADAHYDGQDRWPSTDDRATDGKDAAGAGKGDDASSRLSPPSPSDVAPAAVTSPSSSAYDARPTVNHPKLDRRVEADLFLEDVEQDAGGEEGGQQAHGNGAGRCEQRGQAPAGEQREGEQQPRRPAVEPVAVVLLQPAVAEHEVQTDRDREQDRERDAGAPVQREGGDDDRVLEHERRQVQAERARAAGALSGTVVLRAWLPPAPVWATCLCERSARRSSP